MKLIIFCLLYIWAYYLNACILPPTVPSGQRFIQTSVFKSYINVKQRLNILDSKNFLLFKLKSCGDAFIALSSYPSLDAGPSYEIRIGYWIPDPISFILKTDLPQNATTYKGVVVNCNTYKPFWIYWTDGNIKVGRGSELLQDVIMEYKDQNLNSTQTIRYIGIKSTSGPTKWIFDLADTKENTTEEEYCSETTNKKDIPWCLPVNPCHNKGKCLENETTYSCYCDENSETYGAHCEKKIFSCGWNNPCNNGGRCQDPLGHSSCICTSAYKGDFCNILKQNKPHWKEAFINHHNWSGIYYHANQRVPFSLSVNKLVYGPQHMMLATLKNNETELEMKGFSVDDIYVTFEQLSVGTKLNFNSVFVLSGLLISDHQSGGWEYKGKITRPENNKFGGFWLHSKYEVKHYTTGNKLSFITREKSADDVKIGLGVCFGILVAAGFVIGIGFFLRNRYRRNILTSDTIMKYDRMEEQR